MKPFSLNIKGELRCFDTPAVMGILNVTPDSFFESSRAMSGDDIAARVAELAAAGADFIDIGAFSTRPGASFVSEEDELARLEPAVTIASRVAPRAIISVDTFRASVVRKAVGDWGAHMVNDISGGNIDPDMFDTVAELNVPYVLTHSRGDIADMMDRTDYESVTRDVLAEIGERLGRLSLLGVNDVIIDPGFGFSKTLQQNYQLLADLNIFGLFHRPILVGVSRKSMISQVLGTPTDQSLNGTTVLNTLALDRGASILRVHDPSPAIQAVKIYQRLQSCQVSE